MRGSKCPENQWMEDERVGRCTPPWLPPHTWPPTPMVQRLLNSSSPRNRTQEEDYATLSQCPDHWTPRQRRDHPSHETEVLVAKHGSMNRKLCQRMRPLPTEQKLDTSHAHTDIPHHTGTQSKPVRGSSNGPHHPTLKEWDVQCNTHDHRPWMHKSSHLHPLFDHNHWRRHRWPIPEQCLSMVWTPKKDDLWLRPEVHLPLRQGTDATTGSKTKHINGLPPTDRWLVGEEEPLGRTIPTLCNDHSTGQLERMISNHLPHAQQQSQCHHQNGPTPGPSWILP